MRMPVIAATVGVLAIAAGGLYYEFEIYPQRQFRAGLDQALLNLPPGTTVTYQDAHYSVASRVAVVSGWKIHVTTAGAQPKQIDITLDSLESSNPNLTFSDTWEKARANPTSFSMETAVPVADSFLVKGITFHGDTFNVTQDSIRIDKFRVYPGAILHDGVPSLRDIQSLMAPKPGSAMQPDDLLPLLRLEAAYMLGMAYEGYEAKGMKATVKTPEVELNYDIRAMTGAGHDRGLLKGASIDGVSVRTNNIGSFVFDHVTMGATDIREPATRIMNGEPLSPALLTGMKIGRFEYAGITATVPNQPPFQIAGMSLGPVVFDKGLPVSGELGWKDIHVSKAQLPDARSRDAFDKIGLDAMTVSFAFAYDWDVAQKHATIRDTVLKVNELGTLTLAADLINVIPNAAAMAQSRISHAKLRLEDASVTKRVMAMLAADTDPAAFRVQLMDKLRTQGQIFDQNGNPAMAKITQALAGFIADPHSLTVEMSPPSPIPAMALQGLTADFNTQAATRLGISVTANAP